MSPSENEANESDLLFGYCLGDIKKEVRRASRLVGHFTVHRLQHEYFDFNFFNFRIARIAKRRGQVLDAGFEVAANPFIFRAPSKTNVHTNSQTIIVHTAMHTSTQTH